MMFAHTIRRTTFAMIVASALVACGRRRNGPATPRVTRVDSAGVEIVTNGAARDDAPLFGRLDSVPTLRLGTRQGPPEEQFGSIPALALLSDGGVAVLDAQAAEVRVFGPNGHFRRSLGGHGDGPGEFSDPRDLAALAGDTLAVYDRRAARTTLFAPDGTVARVVVVASGVTQRPLEASYLPDGRLVGPAPLVHRDARIPGLGHLEFAQDSVVLLVEASDGSAIDTLAVLPRRETVRSVEIGQQVVSVLMYPATWARTSVFAATPEGIWAGFADHFSLSLLDATDGHLKRVLRAPGLERPATEAEGGALLDSALANAETPEARRMARQVHDLSPQPAVRPTYDRLVVDDRGRLWLREWPGARTDTHLWWVFARDGSLLGSVNVPGRLDIMAVRGSHVWGVVRDELDVPFVVRYTLETSAA